MLKPKLSSKTNTPIIYCQLLLYFFHLRDFQDKGLNIKEDCLHMAAANTAVDLVKALIKYGCDVNHANFLTDTALHAVCRSGGELGKKVVKILLDNGADINKKTKYNMTPYDIINSKIHGTSCFLQIFDLKPRLKQICYNYDIAKLIMPKHLKDIMIEGVLSPRMFIRLEFVASMQSDMASDGLDSTEFVSRQRIHPEEIMVALFEHVPEEVVKNGVYKTFVTGFVSIMKTISILLDLKRLPTYSRIMQSLNVSWPPSHHHYFENGGKIEYVLKGLFECVKGCSWALGDGSFEDSYLDELEKKPEVGGFDDDFQYFEVVFLDYLLNN